MSSKGKITRRGALVATAMTVFATPAFASLVVQNFMEADITVADACFVKVAGDDITSYGTPTDPDDPLATFDGATNNITVEGVQLLEEKLTVRGMVGDRVTYTDVVRYENNCDVSLDIRLVASSATAAGDWVDRAARIYISDTPLPIGPTNSPTGFPGEFGAQWDTTPIVIEAGGNISVSQTGSVTVPPGEQLQGAITVSAGTGANTAGTGTVNWVAQAVNIN